MDSGTVSSFQVSLFLTLSVFVPAHNFLFPSFEVVLYNREGEGRRKKVVLAEVSAHMDPIRVCVFLWHTRNGICLFRTPWRTAVARGK